MFSLEIGVQATPLIRRLTDSPSALRKAMWQAAFHLRDKVREKVSGPVLQRRKGKLWRSIEARVTGRFPLIEAVIGAGMFYAIVHERGAIIVPKRRRYLRFTIGDREIFTKRVEIPRRPFMRPTVGEEMGRVAEIIAQSLAGSLRSGKAS
jgi:phage gpG-like protein